MCQGCATLPITPWGRYCSHSTEDETEVQRGAGAYPRSGADSKLVQAHSTSYRTRGTQLWPQGLPLSVCMSVCVLQPL